MFKSIRSSKITKFFVYYFSIMIFIETTRPMNAYALTEGPSQPEFNSFTPIGTSDMVDLASGDFNYNIPIMDVGGYPINLAYNSGVTMDQESSWVGLGWNLNIGQINRNVRGIPDDFKGDTITTENNMKKNTTVSVNPYINVQAFGMLDNTINLSTGLEVKYNNYSGLSANPSLGASFNLSKNVSLGLQLSTSDEMGASLSPSLSLHSNKTKVDGSSNRFLGSVSSGITYNSRQGLQNFNLSTCFKDNKNNVDKSGSGGYSFNNNTYTPTKRVAYNNNQYMFSFSVGGSIWGVQTEGSIAASATIQSVKEKERQELAYGYENSEYATTNDLLDFNREKESNIISKSTNVLPVTNYTYDILSIQGQGVSGTIRPYRGQTGYVFDPFVSDDSFSTNVSLELEGGWGAHIGGSFKETYSDNYTSTWNTAATPYFKNTTAPSANYEAVYYKNTTEQRVDPEYNSLFVNNLGGAAPITLTLAGNTALNRFSFKSTSGVTNNLIPQQTFNSNMLKRAQRELRNQVIQKITNKEATDFGLNNKFIFNNRNAKPHHTAGYIVTDENGNKNIFGETAYNISKEEVTYATDRSDYDSNKGTKLYNAIKGEDSIGNLEGIDNYYNNVKTPEYAHTYLLTSILSSDYQDISKNGPTEDDLGSYTIFKYKTFDNYQWRVPFKDVSFNEGLITKTNDQKASYLYGTKELKYVNTIVTKTHVAFIDLKDRADGYGVSSKAGGNDAHTGPKMQRIEAIRLYSRPELTKDNKGNYIDPLTQVNNTVYPIKTAHFKYDYSLCKKIENNLGTDIQDGQNINLEEGKLTLKKVYFTYGKSNMGMYTSYKFNYCNKDINDQDINNYPYNPKNYDVWGNYMPNTSSPSTTTPQEFPYVNQNDKATQDLYASAWSLKSIELPSGGKIEVAYESDDYQYVQNKKAMQMFKVFGVSNDKLSYNTSQLYDNSNFDAKYVVIKIDPRVYNNPSIASLPTAEKYTEITKRYTEGLIGKSIFFDFFMNMTRNQSKEHVTGYFQMDESETPETKLVSGNLCLFIPMESINLEGESNNSNNQFNPISVAGFFFGRENLHREIYELPEINESDDPVALGKAIVNSLSSVIEIFDGANKRLKNNFECAKNFEPAKSWIRLNEPTGTKLGGGVRVKKIEMFDGWDELLDISASNPQIDRYKKRYGQEYNYTLPNGTSSGVATYEPNASKENPFVEPFYDDPTKLSQLKYQEKPFGESFFPGATVTYSKVSVKNITAADEDNNGQEIRKTKSGSVVTQHYTSYDFPTKTDFTDLDKSKFYESNDNDIMNNILSGMLGLNIANYNELTLTQGFYIETNDMNGKVKKQEVYNDKNDLISYVEYIYNTDTDDKTKLNNVVNVIDENGESRQSALGVHYDVVNDMRLNYSNTTSLGINLNNEVIPTPPLVFFFMNGFFDFEEHTQSLRTAVTTKVVHKTGILKEKIAFDLGSKVSTKNLAWDAKSGQVLLTQTVNEFDDNYYSLNYPAYWHYEAMGMASQNIDLKGVIQPIGGSTEQNPQPYFTIANTNIATLFQLGDEMYIKKTDDNNSTFTKVWVVDFNSNKTGIMLIDESGNYIDQCGVEGLSYDFKLIKSGYKNQQMASMASITSMAYPIQNVNGSNRLIDFNFDGTNTNPKIINASAIEYKDFWSPQQENKLPQYPNPNTSSTWNIPTVDMKYPMVLNFNPYVFNYKGNWRPVKSYAYLTGRNASSNNATNNPRNTGFFNSFNGFYKYDYNTKKWVIDRSKWQFASEVASYSPYGVEIENRDALNRYSSAQYGYNYTLPQAVSSNAKYRDMGYTGFEEQSENANLRHFEFNSDDLEYSNSQSHTGRKSIVVKKGKEISLHRKLAKKTEEICAVNCINYQNDVVTHFWRLPGSANGCNATDTISFGKKYHMEFNHNIISFGNTSSSQTGSSLIEILGITQTGTNSIDLCISAPTIINDPNTDLTNSYATFPVTLNVNGVAVTYCIQIQIGKISPGSPSHPTYTDDGVILSSGPTYVFKLSQTYCDEHPKTCN
jgi:hypothetical protein